MHYIISILKMSDRKYRISEWAKFQVGKFLHLKKLPPKGVRPGGGKTFLPTG